MEKIVTIDNVEYLVKEPKYKQIKAVKDLAPDQQLEKLLLDCIFVGNEKAFKTVEEIEDLEMSKLEALLVAFNDVSPKKA
jgi:hypothetical protein